MHQGHGSVTPWASESSRSQIKSAATIPVDTLYLHQMVLVDGWGVSAFRREVAALAPQLLASPSPCGGGADVDYVLASDNLDIDSASKTKQTKTVSISHE